MTKWLVIGGGMRGIIAAIVLKRAGHDVTLIEASPELGGVLRSHKWNGLYVDRGCHLLDFSSPRLGSLFRDILGEEMIPVHVSYASINKGLKSEGIAVPDMSLFPEEQIGLAIADLEMKPGNEIRTAADALSARFGLSAGAYAGECVKKITGHDADELAPEALDTIPILNRMRLGPDETMEELKRKPDFDDRLAVSSKDNPWKFYSGEKEFEYRNAYPAKRGMAGFCDAATAYLERLGVKLLRGQPPAGISIENDSVVVGDESADRCYWSVPSSLFLRLLKRDDPLAAVSRPASILIYTFKLGPEAVNGYTYIHDFSPETLIYRTSAPGVYGKQFDEQGDTYVCAEVPARTSSSIWRDPEESASEVWSEMQATGQVESGARYSGMRVDKLPVAYMLTGKGWSEARVAHDANLDSYRSHIVFADSGALGRAAILDSVESEVSEVVS